MALFSGDREADKTMIRILPESVASKIAAGEVILRASSVVKELLENSCDAEATAINVKVKNGGLDYIIVEDNGVGMSERDLPLSIQRHATSKIRDIEDIYKIRTYGFRGEALSAIASVSKMEIISRMRGEMYGHRLVVEASKIIRMEKVSASVGTTLIVRDIFFNAPVRRNFVRSIQSETFKIIEECIRIALPNVSKSIKLAIDGRVRLQVLPSESYGARILEIFGREFFSSLLFEDQTIGDIRICGYFISPEFLRKTKPPQYIFLNGRYIQDISIKNYVYKAYENLLHDKYHPAFFLFIDMPSSEVDINVHPAKIEVLIKNKVTLCRLIEMVARRALGRLPAIDFNFEELTKKIETHRKSSFSQEQFPEQLSTNTIPQEIPSNSIEKNKKEKNPEELKVLVENPLPHLPFEKTTLIQGVLQLFNSYILAIVNDEVLLVDQNKAHEKILYERYLKVGLSPQKVKELENEVKIVYLSEDAVEKLMSFKDLLSEFGIEYEQLGKNAIMVYSYPQDPANEDIPEMIEFLSKEFLGLRDYDKEEVLIKLARSNAVKPGSKLTDVQMRYIVLELLKTTRPNVSIDSKTTFIKLAKENLDDLMKKANTAYLPNITSEK